MRNGGAARPIQGRRRRRRSGAFFDHILLLFVPSGDESDFGGRRGREAGVERGVKDEDEADAENEGQRHPQRLPFGTRSRRITARLKTQVLVSILMQGRRTRKARHPVCLLSGERRMTNWEGDKGENPAFFFHLEGRKYELITDRHEYRI